MTQAEIDDCKDTQRKSSIECGIERKSVYVLCTVYCGIEPEYMWTIIQGMHDFKWIYMQSVVIESKYNTFVGEKMNMSGWKNSLQIQQVELNEQTNERTNKSAWMNGMEC